MARIARNYILYDGCYCHIISRSNRKQEIFKDDEDFCLFRKLLEKAKNEHLFTIYHYCIMHTHFHLAVQMLDVSQFSRALQKLKSRYVVHFHKKYNLSGPIWRERYKSLLIENEVYLYACGQYIENNPVRAKIVKTQEEWQYSSGKHYLCGEKDCLVDKCMIFEIPKHIKIPDQEFESGNGIGSGFFKYQIKEKMKELW
ncbi:MAG: transposase [Candidatus Omnitrophica bacterium]|nr:transposase [Candidatus Omnitrophota bacterium]